MHRVLIGSRALNFWKPERKINPSTDWDVISYTDFLESEFTDDEDFYNLHSLMLDSAYPIGYSERNNTFEQAILNKAGELGLDVKFVDSCGGEGLGDDYWSVYSFTDGTNTVYVQFDGWYASYAGSEFSEYFFVTPKQVTVTQFEQEND